MTMMRKLIVNAADGILAGLVLAGVICGLYLVYTYADAVLTTLCIGTPVLIVVSVGRTIWARAWERRSR